MKKIFLSLLTTIGILFLTSCNSISQNTKSSRELTEKENSSCIKLSLNDKFNVVLDANATTGYQWEIVKYNKSVIELVHSDYKVDSSLMGAPGKQIYTFKVLSKGVTKLKIIYHRSWEKDVKPAKIFELKIIGK